MSGSSKRCTSISFYDGEAALHTVSVFVSGQMACLSKLVLPVK